MPCSSRPRRLTTTLSSQCSTAGSTATSGWSLRRATGTSASGSPAGGCSPMTAIGSCGRRQTAFDFDDESYGTRNWFALLGPLLLTLKEGAVLLVDELDASLHTALVAEFIRLFQDPKANPNCAQLIFTSHDTTPLGTATGNRPLGREQVWLTEKRTDG